MVMTDEEILSAAARLRAARRRIVDTTCRLCGASIEGVSSRRYCSDRCRMRASRARQSLAVDAVISLQDERRATIERLFKLRDEISGGRGLDGDSTEILRTEREEHSRRLSGS